MALSLDDVQGAERTILQAYQQKVKNLTAAQAVVDRFAQEMLGQTSRWRSAGYAAGYLLDETSSRKRPSSGYCYCATW